VVDPEKWVPDGYACVRVDSRGTGRSPGYVDLWWPRETQDLYECIEWAAEQPWSSGKVGLSGISYYAMNQWQVAAILVSIAVTALVCYLVLGHSNLVVRVLGDTGIRILVRVMGLLLVALAAQYFVNGLADLGVIARPPE